MSIKRSTVAAAFFALALATGPLLANPTVSAPLPVDLDAPISAAMAPSLALASPMQALATSALPDDAQSLVVTPAAAAVAGAQAAVKEQASQVTDLRKALLAMAMQLRDIRYVNGGHDPSTGFDCSGFVRYVFAHAIGLQLPSNSASQFLAGLKVSRDDMQPGDLVFFRTHGKRGISHVGIYISNGRFIHSPSTGKSVEISSLSNGYWAKRFAGAKRPEAMAEVVEKG